MDPNAPSQMDPYVAGSQPSGTNTQPTTGSQSPGTTAPSTNPTSTASTTAKTTNGTTVTMPGPKTGTIVLEPAEWAQHIMRMEWKVARSARGFLKTPALRLLSTAEPRREPLLRFNTRYDRERLEERIAANASNIESAVIQVVGELPPQACVSCLRGYGPWARCVRFYDDEGIVSACGNCTWNQKRERCSFYVDPPPSSSPATPGEHGRDQPSQSSTSVQRPEHALSISLQSNLSVSLQNDLKDLRALHASLWAMVYTDMSHIGPFDEYWAEIPEPRIEEIAGKIDQALAKAVALEALLKPLNAGQH